MAAVTLAPRRMQVLTRRPYLVIDDSYNANFESGTAALQALAGAGVDGRRAAVLGEMLELGPFAANSHADLGVHATDLALLLTVGRNARLIGESAQSRGLAPERWRHFEVDPGDAETVAAALEEVEAGLRDWLRPGDALLVKGSNTLNLAQVANRIAADQS